MDASSEQQGPDDCKSLLEKLSQQVGKISERLSDLEEQVSDLSTDVRLQARKNTIVLSTAGSHDGSVHSVRFSPPVSPRVAGPMAVQIARTRSRHASLVGGASGTLQSQASAQAASVPASETSAASAGASAAAGTPTPAALGAAASMPGSEPSGDGGSAWRLGVFGQVKMWSEDSKTDSPDLKQALQLATAAANAAAEAQAAADRCQQQVMELKGRQGQGERRLDTLWQLQETASSNQAAIQQLQAQLEQQQQAQQQQQENMVALRAQVRQSDLSCAANVSACAELRGSLQQLQQRLEQCCKDVSRQADQMLDLAEQQQAATSKLKTEVQAANQQVQQQLGAKQTQLDSCAAAVQSALGKCEDLRQGAVVLTGRCDAITGHIKAAVDPLSAKLADLEAKASAWSKSAGLAKSAVQQQELAAGLAQLSTAASRRDHERAQQVAGLASRVEALEQQTASRDQVVTQDDLQFKLSEVRASLAASLTQATRELQAHLRTKADEAATSKVTSSLADRVNSSETSLLLGLRSLRDKTAVLIDGKADAAGLKNWQQGVSDSIAELKAQMIKVAGHQQLVSPRGRTSPSPLRAGRADARPSLPAQQAGKRSPGKQRITVSGVVRYWEYGIPATTASAAAALAEVIEAGGQHTGGDSQKTQQGTHEALSVSQCVAAAEAALNALNAPPRPKTQQPAAAVLPLPAEEPLPATAASDAADMAVPQQAPVTAAEVETTGAVTCSTIGSTAVPQPEGPPCTDVAAATATASGSGGAAAATKANLSVAVGESMHEASASSASGRSGDCLSPQAAAVVSGSLSPRLAALAVGAATVAITAPLSPRLGAAGSPLSPRHASTRAAAAAAEGALESLPSLRQVAASAGTEPAAAEVDVSAAALSPAAAAVVTAGPLGIKKYASTKEGMSSDMQAVRKSVRSQSQISSSARAGSLQSHTQQQQQQQQQQSAGPIPAAAARPFSALQPWSVPKSPPSTSVSDLHGAATNAKLVLTGQQKEATRQQLAQKKLPGAVPALTSLRQQHKRNSSGGVSASSISSSGSREASGGGAVSGSEGADREGHAEKHVGVSTRQKGHHDGKAEGFEVVGTAGGHSHKASLSAKE